jgi:hypothetical protein
MQPFRRIGVQDSAVLADNIHANIDALVANENGRPRNELAHLVQHFAAKRAAEPIIRIVTASFVHLTLHPGRIRSMVEFLLNTDAAKANRQLCPV